MSKRRKLTQDIIDRILSGELAIWIWATIDGGEPVQMVFPGKATLHDYPGRKSYFTVPNAEDNFYFKEYDYFWFVCENKEVKERIEKNKKIMDEAYENPEAIPGSGSKYN